MHYIEFRVEGERRINLRVRERIELLELDVDELIAPDTLPNAHQIALLIHNAHIIGNNLRRMKRGLLEQLNLWRVRRDRVQRSVGGSRVLQASDTGSVRDALKKTVTALWGPVGSDHPMGRVGIKSDILAAEYATAQQLVPVMLPDAGDAAPPSVEMSFDDYVTSGEETLMRLEMLEDDLKTKHFDFNNLVKLLEMESFEARRTPTS